MEVRTSSVSFPALRGDGPRTAAQVVAFSREVDRAIAGLTGYSAGFSGGDHHLGSLDLRLDTAIDGTNVTVNTTFGLRDWSGDWDDDYEGILQFVVLAELVPITPPDPDDPSTGPRLDLDIRGMETNQATQHFRSERFLDPPNVRPDNSIRLVARKSTGVRVYVDYDGDAGLPPISSLTGRLEVATSIGSATLTLNPVNPSQSISPRRDSQIDRAQANHTLNFVIPEGWCQGELTLRCKVFDAAEPDFKSRGAQRSVSFRDVAPLNLYGVGVHYTGQGLDLPAPTQAQVMSTMSFVETVYPVGEVLLTGYSTIDFGVDMKADIEDGCGRGFNQLLDRLRDMRGDSHDVYYGLLPGGGIDSGSVGGCGGGGVGAGFVGGGATAAQEIGHAFGRDHAPCDSSDRCGDPSHQDDDYPDYDGFPSDSIGEFGFDPRDGSVLDPASTFDFMGYSGPNWVSPYTYGGLTGKFVSTSGLSASASSLRMLRAVYDSHQSSERLEPRPEWKKTKMPTLFLGLRIAGDRSIKRRPSFIYPAFPAGPAGPPSGFVVELLDGEGRVVSCRELHEWCKHCGPGCWPRSYREQIPWPDDARRLVVREGDERIYEEEIPNPPMMSLDQQYDQALKAFVLKVVTKPDDREQGGKKKDDEPVGELVYLFQFEDGDTWRGVAPRSREPQISIPASLFGFRRRLRVRVLASSGIATGSAVTDLELPEAPSIPEVEIVVLTDEPSAPDERVTLPTVIQVGVVDTFGRSVPDPEVVWYDDQGAEIARGRALDSSALGEGQHLLHVVAVGTGAMARQKSVLVERSGTVTSLLRGGLTSREESRRDVHSHEPGARRRPKDGDGPEQKGG